ncbi:MAG: hypothetical protein LBJ75_01530 [Puniceicoccales bacterium]|jgi:hypothetical protein|nr:hypothetical protein [Puniceicoccales bacterium]
MKKEYKEKLKLAAKYLAGDDSLSVEDNRKFFWRGHKMMEELLLTKDEEVLCGLFDLFTEGNENGVCETLENGIYHNFDFNQILNALYQKFDSLIANNVDRAVYFSESILSAKLLEGFRKMFNAVKAKKSSEFLDRFYKYYPELEENILILRKDMAKW